VPDLVRNTDALELVLTRLEESHDVSAYEAIERLVRAGEEVGLDAHSLVRMLDQGTSFEELLAVIESKMNSSQLSLSRSAKDSRAA
jgi:hypothetical protein